MNYSHVEEHVSFLKVICLTQCKRRRRNKIKIVFAYICLYRYSSILNTSKNNGKYRSRLSGILSFKLFPFILSFSFFFLFFFCYSIYARFAFFFFYKMANAKTYIEYPSFLLRIQWIFYFILIYGRIFSLAVYFCNINVKEGIQKKKKKKHRESKEDIKHKSVKMMMIVVFRTDNRLRL